MLVSVRTTVDLGDELVRQVKEHAAELGMTLSELVESALRAYLPRGSRKSNYRFRWRTESGRVLPGVRLDDRDALLDLTVHPFG